MGVKLIKNYKIMLVIAFVALICSVSFVSANEMDNATNLENNELSLDESDFQVDALSTVNDDSSINDNYNSSSEDDSKLGSSGGEEVLNARAGEKTIDDLKKEVENTPDGGTLVLNSDYGPDKTLYDDPVSIEKSITIDGKNHRIRGIAFSVKTDAINVILKNMRFADETTPLIYVEFEIRGKFVLDGCVFDNCKSKTSGPIQAYGGYVGFIEIRNCAFNKCVADPALSSGSAQWYNLMAQWAAQSRAYRMEGGALVISAENAIIENCNFTNCKSGEGGAIWIGGVNNIIQNCNFDSNHAVAVFETDARGVGGAMYVVGGLEILNCTFKRNTGSSVGGGAIWAEDYHHDDKSSLKIKDCTFIANYLTEDYDYLKAWSSFFEGGSIETRYYNTEISNCYFEGTPEDISRKGGAIRVYNTKSVDWLDFSETTFTITGCTFKNLKADYGGALYLSPQTKGTVKNCSFIQNTANKRGGAIYLDSNGVLVDDCVFNSNSAEDDGGAIYVEARHNSIKNSVFVNNKAKDEGGAFYINARNTSIAFSAFFSNSAKKGQDIYCDSSSCELYNSIILGNSPKEAIYSANQFSAARNWWGNVESNRNVQPDVDKKVNLDNNWFYLKENVKYDHTGSLPSAVVETSIWSNKFNYEVTNYKKFLLDMKFTNTASNQNTMILGGVSDFIIPLTTTNTAVTLSKDKWSHKINLKYDTPIYNRSFSHLKHDIDNSGSVLNLTSDFEYLDVCDKTLINGIFFNKELVIDGNGHTIDGKNTASLFEGGYGKDLTLKNINFVNIKNIYKANGNLYIENCTFNNCGNGLELLRITAGVISIKNSKFYNCSSDSSMFIFDSYGGPVISIVGCEFIGNNANYIIDGHRCVSLNFVQNIYLNNSIADFYKFKMGDPSNASYDYNWFGNTIYNYSVKPDFNVDLGNWMVLDIVDGVSTFGTKFVYLKSYNATSQVLENDTYLDIGFNVSSLGGVVGYVDVISGVGAMNYDFDSQDVVTLSHRSNNFLFSIINYLPGSFTDLQYQINSAGSVLNLTCNYEYMPVCDFKIKHISIDKPLILNGNGFTIDANGMVAIARITAGNVQILNATFINSYSSHNAAIEIYADNVLINSTFINNTLSSKSISGAAIKIGSSNNVVIHSTFIKNNNLLGYGGAISIDQSNNVVIDSIFVNNTAILGGAIYSEWSDVSISGVFANNSAKNGAAIYISARSDKLNRIYKSLFISNRGIDSVINVAGNPKVHAADVHHSIFLDNNCLYDIASSNNDIVYADYNWFGNTNENYNVKPNVASSVNLNRWLFLDVNANSTLLKMDESAVINLSLNKAYDRTDKKIYDVGTNLPEVCFDVSSVNNAAIMDKLELVDGNGHASYVPVDVGMGSVDFKYYSFNKTVTFNVVTVPEDSFTKLQEIINNASVYDSIVLNRSYKYYPNFDSNLKNGIVINKELTLNGNGHVIDGANQARLFNITKPSIQLDNLILVNANSDNGSAIYSIRPGSKLFNSIVLNSTGSVIYSTNEFSVDNCWFGNTVDDYDVAPNVGGDVKLNNWLFLTVDVSKFDLFVGESAVVTLNLTNLYDTNGADTTWTNIIPFAFDLSYLGGDVNVSEAELVDGISKFEFRGYDFESGYLIASYYDVNEELFFNVSCDEDSFTALQKLIDNANGKVVLQHDYKYYDYDEKLKSGILIKKSHIEIDGDGHVIDASNKAGVFNITGEYVAIYDVSIVNSKNTVSVDGGYAAFDNVSFINNTDVISVVDGTVEIVGCYFLNNSNVVDLKSAYDVFISDSTFINNTDIINAFYSTLTVENTSFKGNDVGTYCVSLIDSNAKIHSSKFNEVNLINPIFVSIDSELYLSKNTLSKSQYIDNEGTITSKTRIVIPGEKYYDLLIYDDLTLNATVHDDNGNIIKGNDLEFNINPTIDYNESSQGTVWILDVYCYPCGEHEVNASVIDSLSDYSSDSVLLDVSKFSSSVDFVSLDNITCGEVLNVKVECINFTGAVIEITDDSGEVIFRQTGDMTEINVESLDAGVYTLTYTNVGDDEYESCSVIATFEVYKIGSDVLIVDKVDSIYALNDYRINFTVSNRTNVTAKIVDLKNGEVVLNRTVDGDCLYVNLLAGSYNLTVTNVGDNNHETSSDSMVFDVLKVKSSVKVDDVTDYFYDDVLITYEVVNASDVHVVIRDLATGDVKYNFTSTNTSISDLYFDSGRYNITLSVEESDTTSYSSDSKVFNVLKIGSSIVVEGLDDYVYGDDVEVDVVVDNRTTVVVEIRDKTGKIVSNELIEGDYLPMPDLSAGEYVLFASNLANDNVAGSNYTKAFTISKANSIIDIIYFNDTVPWGYYFDVEFDGDNLTDVYVIVRDSNGNEISGGNLTNDYGYFLYMLGNLPLGDYSIEIINPGDENITGCSVSMNFTIFKGNSTVDIDNISSVYVGDDVLIEYYVFVPGIIDVVVRDSLGNIVYHEDDANIFNVTVSGLPAGYYTVNVTNLETENVFGNYSVSNFTVFKYDSETILYDVSDVVYGDNVLIGFEVENPTVVNVRITDARGNVVYDENETDYGVFITDLDAGDYVVSVTNIESPAVIGSSDSKSFRVLKASIVLTVSVDDSVYGELSVVNVASNVDGAYIVDIGDEELFVNVVNGRGMETIALDAGDYTAKIDFTNDNYDISTIDDSFTVFKADVAVSVEVLDKVYTADVNGIVFASVDGEYKVSIGNFVASVTVKDGVGSFNVGILGVGNYTASVSFDGTNNYNSANNETTFEVTQTGTNFNIIASSTVITYGGAVEIAQSLPGDATGSVTYSFANGTVIQVVGVKESFVLSGLDAGSYVVYADYSGDSNYAPSKDSVTIVVNNAINNVLVYSSDVVYGKNATIIVNADVDGEYTVVVGDRRLIVDVVNGKGDVGVALNAGRYDIAVEYVNDNYVNNVISVPFTVSKADIALTVEVLDKVYTADVNGNVFASVDGEYKVVIGNYETPVIVKNGVGSFDVGILNAGSYDAYLIFLGDDNHNSAINKTSFEVTQTGTNFNIIANSTAITYGDSVEITQNLPGDATGRVTYRFANGTVIKVVGVKESFVLSDLDAGSYVVYADYSGSGKYAPACDSVTITVSKANVTVSVEVLDKIYTADVNGNVFANVDGQYKVVIGNYESLVIVKNGVGSFDVGILDVGKYTASVSFDGTDNYNSASNETTFKVTRTGTNFNIIPNSTVIVYGGSVEIAQGLPGDATGSVTYRFANGTVIRVVGVKESFVLSGLDAGSYVVFADYSGDVNHVSASDSITLTVEKAVNNVLVYASDVVYGENTTIIVNADVDGEYAVVVGDMRLIVDVVNGRGTVEAALNAGSYDVAVEYVNDNYVNNVTSTLFTVSKADIDLMVIVFDVVYPQEVKGVVYSSVDGEFNLTIGNYSTIVVVNNCLCEFNVGVLDAGDYLVSVSYPGDLNHNSNSSSFDVNVAKFTPTIALNVSDIDYGDVEVITITSDVSGTVNVTVNGITQTFDLNATLNLYNLSAGSYPITVVFNSNVNYESVNVSDEFIVFGLNPIMGIDAGDVDVGDDEIITVTLPADATGNVTVSVDGNNYTASVNNGKAIISVPNLGVGDKNANVYYSGDEKYSSIEGSVSFAVDKLKSSVSIDVPVDVKAGESAVVKVGIPGASGNVSVIVDGIETVVPLDENGTASVLISAVEAGNHGVVVVYSGDETHAPVHEASSFKVDEEPVVVPRASEFGEITIGDDQSVSLVLKDEDGNPIANAQIIYVVNGETGNVTSDGDGKFTIVGEDGATITVNYAGNETILGTNMTLKLSSPVVPVVVKVATLFNISNRAITINGYAVDVNAGEEGIYYATSLLDANGKPLSNVYIEFAVNNKIYNRTTYENGSFKPYRLNMVRAGRYTMAFNFAGNDNYTNAFACVCVDLDKKPIKINAPAKSYKAATKTKKYLVTLSTIVGSSHDGKAHLRAGLKVALKVNGKTYSGKINSNGKVVFKITNLNKKGKYVAKISYVGDKTYESASKKVKITVK